MEQDEIIEMAEQVGAVHYWHLSKLEAFAKLVEAKAKAEERKRIHKVMRDAWEDKDWLLISNELNAPDGKIET